MLHADFFELAVPKVAREATRRRMNVSVVKLSELLIQLALHDQGDHTGTERRPRLAHPNPHGNPELRTPLHSAEELEAASLPTSKDRLGGAGSGDTSHVTPTTHQRHIQAQAAKIQAPHP